MTKIKDLVGEELARYTSVFDSGLRARVRKVIDVPLREIPEHPWSRMRALVDAAAEESLQRITAGVKRDGRKGPWIICNHAITGAHRHKHGDKCLLVTVWTAVESELDEAMKKDGS